MYVRHVDRLPSLFKPQPSGCPDDFGLFLDSLALKLDFSIELHYLTLPGRTKASTPVEVFQTCRSFGFICAKKHTLLDPMIQSCYQLIQLNCTPMPTSSRFLTHQNLVPGVLRVNNYTNQFIG